MSFLIRNLIHTRLIFHNYFFKDFLGGKTRSDSENKGDDESFIYTYIYIYVF